MPRRQQEGVVPEDVGAATRRVTRAKGPLADADPNAGSPEKSGVQTRKRGRAEPEQATEDQLRISPVKPAALPAAARRQQRQQQQDKQAPPAAAEAVEEELAPPSSGAAEGDAAAGAAAAGTGVNLDQDDNTAAAADAGAAAQDQPQDQQPEVTGEVQPQQPAAPAPAAAAGGGAATSSHAADMARLRMEGLLRADMEALAQAKLASNTIEMLYTMELPPELGDINVDGSRSGLVEVPATADVLMLKRLFMYGTHNKLHPQMQELVTEDGEVMADFKEDGVTGMPLSRYGLVSGSCLTLRVVIPEHLQGDWAMAAAPETAAYGRAERRPSRGAGARKRWTLMEVDALLAGIEAYGFGAWKSVTRDDRLKGKNNMQAKDKWRNLETAVTRNLPMRGLVLTEDMRLRVLELAAKEEALNRAQLHGGQGDVADGLAGEGADGVEEPEEEEEEEEHQQQQHPQMA